MVKLESRRLQVHTYGSRSVYIYVHPKSNSLKNILAFLVQYFYIFLRHSVLWSWD